METSDDIIDTTLELVSTSMKNFDSTLGKVPIYESGHNFGAFLSRLIDQLVNTIPVDK